MNNWINRVSGRFVSVFPDKNSKEMISDFLRFHKIPNAIEKGKLHCTIAHSLVGAHINAQQHCDIEATPLSVEVWPLGDKGYGEKYALVMTLRSPALEAKYQELRLNGIECQYEKFIPHITLSMDVPKWYSSKIFNFGKPIRFVRQEVRECKGADML